jgi:hypothetical protein
MNDLRIHNQTHNAEVGSSTLPITTSSITGFGAAYTPAMDSNQPTSAEVTSSDDGDASLIRWMLSLTPEARLAVLQGFVDSAIELGNGRPA